MFRNKTAWVADIKSTLQYEYSLNNNKTDAL